jgi:hypothetical protein
MAQTAEQVIQSKIDALRKSVDVEVLKNRVRNYGQQALEAKRVKNAKSYKAAKEQQDKAQAELDSYNQKMSALIKQSQAAIKLGKVSEDLKGVTKERNFYIEAGLEVPEDVEKKYQDLTSEKKGAQAGTKGAEGYVGTGSKDKPLTLDGENFTGKYKGKEYKDGVLVKAPSSVKDSDGDGVPDAVDATPNKKTPPPAGGTGGTGGTGGGKGGQTPTPTPGQDVKDLWISYLRSTFATLEDKTQKGEIDLLIKRAKDEKWDEDTFMSALEGTVWWQSTYPSMRQFFLDTHDPRKASTFAEKVSNTMDSMMGKLEALGITVRQVDPATGKVIDNSDFLKGIALKSIQNNWDDDQLEQYLATQGSVVFSGGGTLGSYYDRIAQQAYLYGVPLDETMKKTINTSLLDPLDGRDANYWIKTVKDMAYDAPQNKPFLASLQAGRNLYEVTNSYRQQMASLLEVDSTAITWNDLMGKVVDTTTGNARTFADFTKQLKSDPLWQYTKNAKETYSNTALDIAKMFGFVG